MRISDWSSDVCSSDLNEGIAGPRALAADRPARDFPIFIFLGDAGVGIAERKGRIPADTDRFARLARRDARILDLREAFEPVRKFIVDLRGAQIALAREDQRAAGALVITVTVGQKIARIAIVRSEEHPSELQSLLRKSYA